MNYPFEAEIVRTISSVLYRSFTYLSTRTHKLHSLFRILRFFTSRPTRYSMDSFSKALVDYSNNSVKSKFIYHRNCLPKKYNDHDWIVVLKSYFRSFEELNPLEKEVINRAYGDFLDVGCCTGNDLALSGTVYNLNFFVFKVYRIFYR